MRCGASREVLGFRKNGLAPGNVAPIRIDLHTLVQYWLITPFTCAVVGLLILAALWYFHATRDLAEEDL